MRKLASPRLRVATLEETLRYGAAGVRERGLRPAMAGGAPLAIDVSTPAIVGLTNGYTNGTTSLASNSFSPPADSLLAVICGCTFPSPAVQTISDTLAASLTYEKLVAQTGGFGDVEIWLADVPSIAPGSMTLTINMSAAGDLVVGVIVFTGAQPMAAQIANANVGAHAEAHGAPIQVWTPKAVAADSQVIGVVGNWSNNSPVTPIDGQTLTVNGLSYFFNDTHESQGWWAQVLSDNATGGYAVEMGDTAPAANYWVGCCAEILAADGNAVAVRQGRMVSATPMRASTR